MSLSSANLKEPDNATGTDNDTTPRGRRHFGLTKRGGIIAGIVSALLIVGLAVGLGVGLSQRSSSSDKSSEEDNTTPTSNPASTATSSTTNPTSTASTVNGTFWEPAAGDTWQIELLYTLNDTSNNASIYDIDLFDNPTSILDDLHDLGRKVICYFSAGSYEDFRSDASSFHPSDYGKELDGWPGEYWLNTSSPNVRSIMQKRLDLAVEKGCDGVDPDNVDGYDNDNGIGLTQAMAVEYVNWLADEAHSRGMAVGLKNAAKLIPDVLDAMQWQVNEQCVQYSECAEFQPFIDAGKPVFHIEYPTDGGTLNVVSASTKKTICGDADAKQFSTVLKNMILDNWVVDC
jgi:hypothetical protein